MRADLCNRDIFDAGARSRFPADHCSVQLRRESGIEAADAKKRLKATNVQLPAGSGDGIKPLLQLS